MFYIISDYTIFPAFKNSSNGETLHLMRFAAHLMCVSSPFGITSSCHCAFLPPNVSEGAHWWPGHCPALLRVSDWVALGSSVSDCSGPAPVHLLLLGSQCMDGWLLIGRRLSEETEASRTRHDSLSLPCVDWNTISASAGFH